MVVGILLMVVGILLIVGVFAEDGRCLFGDDIGMFFCYNPNMVGVGHVCFITYPSVHVAKVGYNVMPCRVLRGGVSKQPIACVQ